MAVKISGPIIDALNSNGFQVVRIWGADGCIISAKRKRRWVDAMKVHNQAISEDGRRIITRCIPREGDISWLPFPNAIARWSLDKGRGTEDDSGQFVANAKAASLKASALLGRFPVSQEITVAADLTLGGGHPYIDFYFGVPLTTVGEFNAVSTWINQEKLFQIVLQEYPSALAEYSPEWLSPLRLDIFIPSLNTAIEYNGQQHYRPVEYFGGLESFKALEQRDRIKAELCKRRGVRLIIWPYWQRVDSSVLRKALSVQS